jgi:hypothetical protein
LPERDLGQDVLDEVGRGGAPAATEARRAKSAALTAERDEAALVARPASKPGEASAEQAAVEVRLELLLRVLGQAYVERAVVDGSVEGFEVVAHDLVKRRGLGAVAVVAGGAVGAGERGGGQVHVPPAWRASCRRTNGRGPAGFAGAGLLPEGGGAMAEGDGGRRAANDAALGEPAALAVSRSPPC